MRFPFMYPARSRLQNGTIPGKPVATGDQPVPKAFFCTPMIDVATAAPYSLSTNKK
ncbi:hypothetical protein Q8O96_30015 [Pseudomonas sp. LPH60]|uniref:hypothetical protein n=1 Tax=Pseudomonas sp. LPH60 TaxID=3065906 RepID=UPI00273B9E5A|nr:hypothetical protein [Pseudomonas sp. LPH60]MDP4573306.1 hypothetical protein [Pseudomonas sp. LPH60]